MNGIAEFGRIEPKPYSDGGHEGEVNGAEGKNWSCGNKEEEASHKAPKAKEGSSDGLPTIPRLIIALHLPLITRASLSL